MIDGRSLATLRPAAGCPAPPCPAACHGGGADCRGGAGLAAGPAGAVRAVPQRAFHRGRAGGRCEAAAGGARCRPKTAMPSERWQVATGRARLLTPIARPCSPPDPAAVAAAQRYIPDRRLPDSAIDVMDEAAARTRLRAAAAAQAAAQQAAMQHVAAATGAAASRLQGGPLLDAGPSSSEHTRRLHEWLQATQQEPGPGAAQAAPATATAAAQSAGLGASAVHALSCPHCGTPAVPEEGSGALCRRCCCRAAGAGRCRRRSSEPGVSFAVLCSSPCPESPSTSSLFLQ